MLPVESRSLKISVALHVLLALVAFVGLPALLPEREEPMPLVMSVELLPISDISNVKPSDTKIQKEQHAPTPPMPKPVPPSVTEKPKEVKPEPKPEPKAAAPEEPAPVEETHFDPNEGKEPKPKAPPKPEEAQPANSKSDDFAALLSKLQQEAPVKPSKDAKDSTNTAENKTKSEAAYDASLPLSISERDAIRSQFVQCWRVPAGAKAGESLAVRVHIELQEDGTVKTAEITSDQKDRYRSDTFFRAAADSALRAVHKCSPLQNLPRDKYGSWREMELNFDPKDML